MKRALAAAMGLGLALVGRAHGKPASTGARTPVPAAATAAPSRPAAPLPMLPALTLVRVEAARDWVVVVEEVGLPRGDWRSGGLDLYVAFGAPGVPTALDARLVSVAPGTYEARAEDSGERVALERAVKRDARAQLLLGPPQMAGVVVHVAESQLRRGFDSADRLVLRLRSLLASPVADASGARDVVVRLGVADGSPLTLRHIQVASLEPSPRIGRAEASLCGPDADPWPLTVERTPAFGRGDAPLTAAIAPESAVRHASDDLCVRWWSSP